MVSYCSNPDCDVHNEDLYRPLEMAPLISCCLFIVIGFVIATITAVALVVLLVSNITKQ
jgi:hypothetical protein